MKRFLKFIFASVFVVSIAFLIYKITDKYDLQVKYDDINWTIKTKGIEEGRSFYITEDNVLYIAYKDTISVLKGNNKETVIELDGFDIYDIVADKDKLIIATDNRVVQYDLATDIYENIIEGLPNYGLHKDTKLLLDKDNLYVTIGSNTNSGIVEKDKDKPDKPSFSWVASGATFGEAKTSGFSKYGVSVTSGEVGIEAPLSNASILKYSLEDKSYKMFASGIRNIEGLDSSKDGKIIAIYEGMNNSGPRPIYNDSDYIYEIKEDAWYGWPDYSGGDSVESARFTKPNYEIKSIITNPPTKSLYGPMYQHNSLGAINGLAISKRDGVLKEDTIIFADNSNKQINILTKNGVALKIAELADESYIEKIMCTNDRVYMLDDGTDCIYELSSSDENRVFYMHDLIKIFSIIFLLVIGICVIYKLNKKDK